MLKCKLIVLVCLVLTLLNCKNEYANSAPLCVVALARLQQNLAKDLQDLNDGKISQSEYNEGVRLRESGAYGLCLMSLIKREQNGNF